MGQPSASDRGAVHPIVPTPVSVPWVPEQGTHEWPRQACEPIQGGVAVIIIGLGGADSTSTSVSFCSAGPRQANSHKRPLGTKEAQAQPLGGAAGAAVTLFWSNSPTVRDKYQFQGSMPIVGGSSGVASGGSAGGGASDGLIPPGGAGGGGAAAAGDAGCDYITSANARARVVGASAGAAAVRAARVAAAALDAAFTSKGHVGPGRALPVPGRNGASAGVPFGSNAAAAAAATAAASAAAVATAAADGAAASTDGVTNSGRGMGWSDAERVVLCRAALKIMQDPVTGTDQSGKVFYARIAHTFRQDMEAVRGQFPKRSTSAITKEFRDNISKQTQRYASSWSYIKHAKLTGNPTEEDLIRGATARYLGKKDWYAAIRGGVDAGGNPTHETCRILPCWRVLRVVDKFSGAAYDMASGAMGDEEFILDDAGRPLLGKRGAADFQDVAGGTQAAKAARSSSMALVRECAANTKAMTTIGETAQLRLQVAFMSDPSVRNTEEGRRFHANLLAKIMRQSDREAVQRGTGMSSGQHGSSGSAGGAASPAFTAADTAGTPSATPSWGDGPPPPSPPRAPVPPLSAEADRHLNVTYISDTPSPSADVFLSTDQEEEGSGGETDEGGPLSKDYGRCRSPDKDDDGDDSNDETAVVDLMV